MNQTGQERSAGRSTATGRTSSETRSTAAGSQSATEGLRRDVAQAGDQVKQRGEEFAAEARQQLQEAKHAAEESLHQATEQAKTTGREYAVKKKQMVTEELKVFRDAIQRAADTLRDEDHEGVAQYAAAMAEQLDRCRIGLENRNLRDLLREAQGFTRRRPEVVYGGLFVAGLAMMRFLKATSREELDQQQEYRSRQMGNRPMGTSMPQGLSQGASLRGNLGSDTHLVPSKNDAVGGANVAGSGQASRTSMPGSAGLNTGSTAGTGTSSGMGSGASTGAARTPGATSGSGSDATTGAACGTGSNKSDGAAQSGAGNRTGASAKPNAGGNSGTRPGTNP